MCIVKQAWPWQLCVVVEIIRGSWLKCMRNIRMRIFDAIINQRDSDAFSRGKFPCAFNVQIMAWHLLVQNVPLLVKQRVSDAICFCEAVCAIARHRCAWLLWVMRCQRQ